MTALWKATSKVCSSSGAAGARSRHWAKPEAAIETGGSCCSDRGKMGAVTFISWMRTSLTQLTPAYELDQRIAW